MRELSLKEEKSYYAGGFGAIFAAIAAGVSLVIGFFDGLTRPFGCR